MNSLQEKSPTINIEPQKILTSQAKFTKKNKIGSIILSPFKIYYKAAVLKAVWSDSKTDLQANERK